MLLWNYLRQLVRDLLSQRLRAAMTIFGIVWGTVAVTLLLAFGDAMHRQLRKSQKGLGESIVICWPTQTSKPWQGLPRGRRVRVTDEDLAVVRREVPEISAITSEYSSSKAPFKVGTKVLVPSLHGASPVFGVIRNFIPAAGGRFLDPLDMSDRKRVVFLGDKLARELFGDAKPVGERVYLAGAPFLVIGVMEPKQQDSNYNGPDASQAVIPSTTYKAVFGDRYVDNFLFQVKDPEKVEAATEKLLGVLARRHKFDPTDREAIMMWDTTEMMAFFETFFALFKAFLAVLGVLTLVVGGIGVSNIMNVVVEERTSEVGLKMALGAKRRLVLGQFLLETFLITLVGGALGFGISWGICAGFPSLGLGDTVGTPVISAQIVLGTVTALGVISLLAGYFPARTAARLHPVEALKM